LHDPIQQREQQRAAPLAVRSAASMAPSVD
jgi:hypothetical protein